MKFAIFLTMKRVVIGCLCGAGALATVACADGRGVPTSPSPSAVSILSPTAAYEGTGSPAVAATPATIGKGRLPFHGTLEAVEVHSPDFPITSVTMSGTGHATHLGRFTATYAFTINLPIGFGQGTFTLTAANGDTLFGSLTGLGVIEPDGLASIVETHTITGGTGRFADATGSYTLRRLAVLATGISSGSFDGTISY